MTASFILNGAPVALRDADPTESLLRWLKRQRLAGTKEGCGDGDCGACTVAMIADAPDGTPRWQAVNACLLPMGAMVGREVRTVESLDTGGVLHPVQQAMVDCAGSQCGYCTPGFVMSLFVAQANGADYEDAIEGNLCRCTGYRPIREAAAQLQKVALPSGSPRPFGVNLSNPVLEGGGTADSSLGVERARGDGSTSSPRTGEGGPSGVDWGDGSTGSPRTGEGERSGVDRGDGSTSSPRTGEGEPSGVDWGGGSTGSPRTGEGERSGVGRGDGSTGSPRTVVGGMNFASLDGFANPRTIAEAIALKAANPQAAWIAGGTDTGVELSRGRKPAAAFIALDRIAELDAIEVRDEAVRIGAGASLTRIERELHGLFRSLDEMLHWFAARQVRNRATLGGNLGSASPIGDLLPVLLALDATLHVSGPDGTRDLPVDGFFLDYRKTARAADELIAAVTIPRRAGRIDASYKVAKRQTDDISIVAAAFALERDAQGRVAQARLAYGGVAAVPRRAVAVENFLHGKALDEVTVTLAAQQLREAFTPLSDHRADADYRRALCGNLFAKFVAEHAA